MNKSIVLSISTEWFSCQLPLHQVFVKQRCVMVGLRNTTKLCLQKKEHHCFLELTFSTDLYCIFPAVFAIRY